MSCSIKTRFCPSPTGLLHLGNIRTALFNALVAFKNDDSKFLLRIEDTDLSRSKNEYIIALKEDLTWLGIDWDEGSDKDLNNGPYLQSKRGDLYQKYYQELLEKDLVYFCFCSENELKIKRKIQLSANLPPRYDGSCRKISTSEAKQRLNNGQTATLRFKVDKNAIIKFNDLVKGSQIFKGCDIGDFIIRRTDLSSSFMFCNSVDDALMKVSHVLRGDDHLTNTPRQILILQALDLPVPEYGHISTILGEDNKPLSKRNGSQTVKQLHSLGFLPLAIINYLARLGHYYRNNDLLSFKQLAEYFHYENLNKSAAKFDYSQLLYWQKLTIQQMDSEDFWKWSEEGSSSLVPVDKKQLFIEAVKPNITVPNDVVSWAKCLFVDSGNYSNESTKQIQLTGKDFFAKCIKCCEKTSDNNWNTIINFIKKDTKIGGKSLFKPLRLALTNKEDGPQLDLIYQLLGHREVINRLIIAKDLS